MLRRSLGLLRVQSHQKKRSQHPNAGTRYGRVYNRGFVRYGFGGYGMSVYSAKKDRRFQVLPTPVEDVRASKVRSVSDNGAGMAESTRTLSPNFRTFALSDGGVFISHPSHRQVMEWGQKVHTEESDAQGRTAMDEYVNSRIQAIMADNTLENVSLSEWRKNHIWNLVKSHGNLQRRWGTPDSVKGARSNLYGNN